MNALRNERMLVLCGLLAAAAGSTPAQDKKETVIPIIKEWKEASPGGGKKKERVVIGKGEEWQKVWSMAYANIIPPPKAPDVDFSKHMALAVFMGEKPTTGYETWITKVVKTEKGLKVYVRETAPKADDVTGQAITAPFHIVIVPKSDVPVTFMDD
jgi:hypothetical protein